MKYPFTILAAVATLTLVCCKSEPTEKEQTKTLPDSVPAILDNQLSGSPSALLTYASESKVNWQPWSPQILEHARESNRMILALLVTARYPECYKTLSLLEQNPDLTNRINQNFIPVLADIDLNRETSLIANKLSTETRTPVAFPFLVFLSPDGCPVTWRPVLPSGPRDLQDFFDNTLEVVGRLWEDSPDYVVSDSKKKNELRRKIMEGFDQEVEDPEERQRLYKTAIRRILSVYDEDIVSFSGAGGLFPLGMLDLLTLARHDPTLPADQRKKIGAILESFCPTLFNSAIVDVLDGGIFPARRGSTWNLVLGNRDCSTQGRAIRVLARMHQLDGYPGTLETAVDAAGFAESQFQTTNGLFSLTRMPVTTAGKLWLWTMDQVSSVLTEDEHTVWKTYSSLSDIGNLPSEADPNRTYFRLNFLAPVKSPQQVAELTGFEIEKVQSLIESGRKKLLKAREDRTPSADPDPTPSALASFRMASAYAALYAATGEEQWREKAKTLGKASRKHFLSNRFLNLTPDAPAEGASDGRAFAYAIAVQSGLDLGAITLDDEWYSWAQDLSTLLAEHFVNEKTRLLEVRKVSTVVNLDLQDLLMTFDDSSAGVVRLNLKRLAALGFLTPPALKPWVNSLPPVDKIPIVFTDSLLAMSHEWNHTFLKVGNDAAQELTDASSSQPLQLYVRRRAESSGVTAISADGSEKGTITTPDELRDLRSQPQP